jgi:Transglutaminase-like superfamily
MIGVDRWTGHSRMSDPAKHADCVAALPSGVSALNRVVQGLLIHSDWLSAYDVDERQLRANSRKTLPVADRLVDILEDDRRPLHVPRLPPRRSAGTCRDFSLMACSFLRVKGVPSRIRCGFASYFGESWEDHWVCEFWDGTAQMWRLSDPQIDEVMRARLRIEFDPANVPRTSFLTAGEAWMECRAGRSDPRRFGHGEATGFRFLKVNVVRDHYTLNGRETSAWDEWRTAPPPSRLVKDRDIESLDCLAAKPEIALTEVRPDRLE